MVCPSASPGHTTVLSPWVAVVLDGADLRGGEEALPCIPAPDGVDEALVLRFAPVGNLRRLGATDPPIAQEPPGEHAVREELHAELTADVRHAPRRAAVEQ